MALCYVPPSTPIDDSGDVGLNDYKPDGKILLGCETSGVSISDFLNICFGKFSKAVLLPPCWQSSLLIGINLIISIATKKKMAWIYATFVIALMTYHHADWNWPNVHFERESVYAASFSASFNVCISVGRYAFSNPFPATRLSVFIDPGPKPLRESSKFGSRRFFNHFPEGCQASRSFVSNLNIFSHGHIVPPSQINLKENC